MGMGVENGEEDAVLVMVATKPGNGVEMMKKTGRSVQELATVVGDLMVDMASAIRSGGRQSFLEQTQGVMQVHAQRLKQALSSIAGVRMLRRKPTRLELKAEDKEEYDEAKRRAAAAARAASSAGPTELDTLRALHAHRGSMVPLPTPCLQFLRRHNALRIVKLVRSRASHNSLCGGQCLRAMGNWISKKEPPPPVVLVPLLLERPHFATRSRMTESSYDLMFSKLAGARLFNMYFDESRNVLAQFVLQPADDPRVDVTGQVLAPTHGDALDSFDGEAVFRWQRKCWILIILQTLQSPALAVQ